MLVTVTLSIAPPEISTDTVPEEPSPLIGIAEIVVPDDVVNPVPADLIFTILIAPSVAADETVLSVDTCIKSVDKKFVCSEAVRVYINFHLYPSPVVRIDVEVPVGSTVELAPPLLSKHL